MKLLHAAEWLLDKFLFVLFLLAFLIGIYGLYDGYRIYTETTDSSLLYYKPGYESDKKPEREINGNMVAWLTIEGTGIDYPVMQGIDNFEYLNKNPYGDFSLSGSIFLDSRNNPDFSDEYSLIYGHHMENGLMFGDLDNYLNEEFFINHRDITLSMKDTVLHPKIFAVLDTDAEKYAIFAPTEVELQETLRYIQENCLYSDPDSWPEKGDKVLALSTCKYPDTTERTVVFCQL